jgi:hypothetical protein
MWRWARRALCGYALVTLGEWAVASATFSSLRNQLHQFMNEIHAGSAASQPTTTLTTAQFAGFGAANLLDVLLLLVGVCFLIWQYRAATVARNLGYPARRSPGLGVGGWFIPLVNLWFPYQSLRDLLPPTHAMRRWALLAWLAYLGTSLFGTIGAALLALGPWVAGIAVLVLAAACLAAAVLLGWRLVVAVEQDHVAGVAAATGTA